ncbi:hypothetical protein D3C75_916400 [compost metagenome]
MSTKRVDAVGQEIKIGDIVMPFMKSSHNLEISIVTRFNPKMVQLNGGELNIESERMVVVTDNLIALGKQSTVDKFRQQYASKMDHSEKEHKLPVRYVILGSPRSQTPSAWVARFDYEVIDSAREMKRQLQTIHPEITHALRKGYGGKLYWTRDWHLTSDHVFAWRSLPDSVAAIANGPDAVNEIPHDDKVNDLDIK